MGWVGDLIGGLFGFGSDMQKRKREALWRQEDQMREDTSYQRTAEDMMKAGLNPATMSGLDGGAMNTAPSGFEATNGAIQGAVQRSADKELVDEQINAENARHNADIDYKKSQLEAELKDLEEKIRSNKATEADRARARQLEAEANALEKSRLETEKQKEARREIEEREKRWNNVITKGAIDPSMSSESVGLSKIFNASHMTGSEGSTLEDLGVNTNALSGFVKEKKLDVSDWIDTRQYIDSSSNQNIGNVLVFRDNGNGYYLFKQKTGTSKPEIYHLYNYNEIEQRYPSY